MHVSLLVVLLATILLVQDCTCWRDPFTAWATYVRQYLQTIENGYYGCWKDERDNRLLRHEIGRGVQNIQDCAARCEGYMYFGMQDRDQCFCGNRLHISTSRNKVSDNECYSKCRHRDYNNNYWICGAPGRITVFRTENHYTYMERFPDDPQTRENGYYGCWRDGTANRVLSHESGRGVQNIQDCAVRCLGYMYFGMEDKDKCFCGNSLPTSSPVSDDDCSKICRSPDYVNHYWICGAANRISVYNTEDHYTYMERFPNDPLWKILYARQHLQTIESGYYGCWKNDRSNRLLLHESGRGVENIPDCAVRCRGYSFFGMEDKDHCFCGNQLDLSRSRVRVSDNDCDTLCNRPDYNNNRWICGAANRISMYTTEHHYTYMERFPDDPLWKLLYARQHLQTIDNGYYGCWKDNRDNRLLQHEIEGEVENIQDCALQCTGYSFSGIEDQDSCFCGNQLDLSRTRVRVSENDCDRLCRDLGYNNTHWICGAANRISVYITERYLTYMEQFTNDSLVQAHLDHFQMHDD